MSNGLFLTEDSTGKSACATCSNQLSVNGVATHGYRELRSRRIDLLRVHAKLFECCLGLLGVELAIAS